MDIWDILMSHPLAVTIVVSIISSAVFCVLFNWLLSAVFPQIQPISVAIAVYNTNNWKSTEVSIGLIISCIFESDGYCVESSGLDIVAIPESLASSFLIVDIQFVTPKKSWLCHFCITLIVAYEFRLCLQPVGKVAPCPVVTPPRSGFGSALSIFIIFQHNMVNFATDEQKSA